MTIIVVQMVQNPSGGELIVLVSSSPDKYYRMGLDGLSTQLIGELNGFY